MSDTNGPGAADGWPSGERERAAYAERSLAVFRESCRLAGAVPTVMVGVKPEPGGRWSLHVVSASDGPIPEADVFRAIGWALGDLIAHVTRPEQEGGGG